MMKTGRGLVLLVGTAVGWHAVTLPSHGHAAPPPHAELYQTEAPASTYLRGLRAEAVTWSGLATAP